MSHNPADFVGDLHGYQRASKGFGGQNTTVYILESFNSTGKMIKGKYTHL